jgi:hypothetical protein
LGFEGLDVLVPVLVDFLESRPEVATYFRVQTHKHVSLTRNLRIEIVYEFESNHV